MSDESEERGYRLKAPKPGNPGSPVFFALGMTLLSLLFFESAALFFLFPLPLALLYSRKGGKWFVSGAAVMLGAVLLVAFIKTRGLSGTEFSGDIAGSEASGQKVLQSLMLMEVLIPFILLFGVFAAYTPFLGRLRRVYRLTLATLAVGCASVPLFLYFSSDEGLKSFFAYQMRMMTEVVRLSMAEPASFESSVFNALFDQEKLQGFIRDVLYRSYLAWYFVVVAGCVWMAESMKRRLAGGPPRRFDSFFVPDPLIWGLIASLGGVLLDLFIGIGEIGYLFWNLGAIFLVLYGVSGIGIISSLFNRYGVRRGMRSLFWFLILMLLLWPRVNLLCIIGIPALGVSEIWIKLREKT